MNKQDRFQQDEQAVHELYQSLDKEQPPEFIDRQILSAAHREVSRTDKQQVSPKSWYVPVSLAAVLVLSLSVVVKLSIEPEVIQQEQESIPAMSAPVRAMQDANDERGREDFFGVQDKPRVVITEKNKVIEAEQVSRLKKSEQAAGAPAVSRFAAPQPAMETMSLSDEASMHDKLDDDATAMQQQIYNMQALLKDGKLDELEKAIQLFEQNYPGHRLPADILEWKQSIKRTQD